MVFVLEGGGSATYRGGAKTKCSPPDTEFDAGYFREGEDRLFKAAFFGRALFLPFCEVFVERDRRRAFVDFLPEFFPDKVVAGRGATHSRTRERGVAGHSLSGVHPPQTHVRRAG